MNYDRPDWHLEDNFPEGLPEEAAATHIGIFLAWAILRNREGEDAREFAGDLLAKVRAREMTGREFFLEVCDGKLWSSDFNAEANRFAEAYYCNGRYLKDYKKTLAADLPSIYHVEDTWQNYELMAEVLDARFKDPVRIDNRPWWKFW